MMVSLVSGIIALASTLFINQANANDKACLQPPRACSPHISAPVDPINYTTALELLELEGEGLLREELQKLTGGHTRYSYNCVWSFMMEADEDPDNPENILALYTRRSIPKVERDCGTATESGAVNRFAWNREHVWAKSHGFPRQGQHAYTDFHHLIAADKRANSNRGNKDFKAGGAPDRDCTKCQTTGVTWEPSDASKGIVARMLFYMDVRYDGIGSSGGTPDLQLVNTASKAREPRLGYLSDLLKWHCEYPVSDEERRRNNSVHKWQGNRNPFIDHPEFVEAIWDFSCDSPQVDSPKKVPAQWGDAVPTQHDTSTAASASAAAAINMNDHPTSSFDASTLAGACMVVMLAFVVIVKRRGGYHREGYVNIATNKA
mmetsp:Transcript_48392/g.54850  ORF Transcript_48392/g.54850 Transcript_48392/m.54850 type:complete len:376 (+) Transcript_48392:153-1280(+)